MSVSVAHKRLFELWHQSSLSALSVDLAHLGMDTSVPPDTERAFLDQALKSWNLPEPAKD